MIKRFLCLIFIIIPMHGFAMTDTASEISPDREKVIMEEYQKALNENNVDKKIDLYVGIGKLFNGKTRDYAWGEETEIPERFRPIIASIKELGNELSDKLAGEKSDLKSKKYLERIFRLSDGTMSLNSMFQSNYATNELYGAYAEICQKNPFFRLKYDPILNINPDLIVDLDGNSRYACFVIGYYDAKVYSKGMFGRVNVMTFSGLVAVKHLKTYNIKDTKKQAVLYFCKGGNGGGASRAILIGLKKDKPAIIFESPEAYSSGTRFLDKNGQDEIFGEEVVVYKMQSWPFYYRWNGNEFVDESLLYSEKLISYYRERLETAEKIKNDPDCNKEFLQSVTKSLDELDKHIQRKSFKYKEFWEKYLKPIRQEFEKQ